MNYKWISINERPPFHTGHYLCAASSGHIEVSFFDLKADLSKLKLGRKHFGKWGRYFDMCQSGYVVTHWMPLPAAPVKESKPVTSMSRIDFWTKAASDWVKKMMEITKGPMPTWDEETEKIFNIQCVMLVLFSIDCEDENLTPKTDAWTSFASVAQDSMLSALKGSNN